VTKDSFKQAGETTVEVWLASDGSKHAGAKVGGTLTLPGGEKVTVPVLVFSASGKDAAAKQ
jgi:hypothetical protein